MHPILERLTQTRTTLDTEQSQIEREIAVRQQRLDTIQRERASIDGAEKTILNVAGDLLAIDPGEHIVIDDEPISGGLSVQGAAHEVLRGVFPGGLTSAEIRERAEPLHGKPIKPETMTVMLGRLKDAGKARLDGRIWFRASAMGVNPTPPVQETPVG